MPYKFASLSPSAEVGHVAIAVPEWALLSLKENMGNEFFLQAEWVGVHSGREVVCAMVMAVGN